MDEAAPIDINRPETWPASAREYLARHRPPPSDSGLRDALREEIRAGGPIPFARFMERALYDPQRGYYTAAAGRLGAGGDFVTAPTTHPAFGALLCRRVAQLWDRLGRPDPFMVAEAGAGTGALAAQILKAASDLDNAFSAALRYRLIEPYAGWREAQQPHLAPWADRVTWHADLEEQPDPPHLLLANELLDALPVHRVVRRQAGLRERYVSLDEQGELSETEGPLSTEELSAYFARLGLQPPLDTPVEVNLAARSWLRRALAITRGGWFWLLDYGAEAAALYAAPRAGTLRAFHDHALATDPLARVGSQDLTADVDFTTLIHTAEAAGWVVEEFTTQRDLLLSLGLKELLPGGGGTDRSGLEVGAPSTRHPTPDAESRSPGYWALLQLIDPHGLGAVRSLLLCDDTAPPSKQRL